MYTTPDDAPLKMKWSDAMFYAAGLNAHQHKDWRVPTSGELNVLFNNQAAIGGFNVSGSAPATYYRASTELINGLAWNQCFSKGLAGWGGKSGLLSLRCVR